MNLLEKAKKMATETWTKLRTRAWKRRNEQDADKSKASGLTLEQREYHDFVLENKDKAQELSADAHCALAEIGWELVAKVEQDDLGQTRTKLQLRPLNHELYKEYINSIKAEKEKKTDMVWVFHFSDEPIDENNGPVLKYDKLNVDGAEYVFGGNVLIGKDYDETLNNLVSLMSNHGTVMTHKVEGGTDITVMGAKECKETMTNPKSVFRQEKAIKSDAE